MKAFYVKWMDATSTLDQGWQQHDEIKTGLSEIQSIGFLLDVTEDYITLVLSVSEDYGVSGDITIPRIAILELKEIELGK